LISNEVKYRYLFAGGGTGGHLYPAIAVAQKIMELQPNAEILFIGTKTKIEAKVVPQIGFKFKTIWISGFSRKLNFSTLLFPIKLFVSMIQSLIINFIYKPHVAIGTGAYVSGPAIWGATFMGAKGVLLEQNSYPGITNRMLEKKVKKIFLSFDESKKYFRDITKLEVVGNPIRIDIALSAKEEAKQKYGLDKSKKTIVIIGGSLGAQSINNAIKNNLNELVNLNIQILWQTGARYFSGLADLETENIKIVKYFNDIALAYSAADLIIARAGATTIAEVAHLGLPVVFVPSPNVAENHQFKNAEVLKNMNAAELIEDNILDETLVEKVNILILDSEKLEELRNNIKKFDKPDATNTIANEIIKMATII
jgi:UDP-N-acetylglucosamine--N-acetylmuramyl-(pentapeptide) pyrophosphoryl-undecaprenol N-acetylglucosamine transferase